MTKDQNTLHVIQMELALVNPMSLAINALLACKDIIDSLTVMVRLVNIL